ncbi:uncharacterized protein C8Q71DRAFT_69459 [Rhodofomes roseus]|uniref:Zn(2)-C6 fungal-type domain-containing protein n=1 Tax=Rhodofomes roseus TaxID=34475 RepID=A0ABQ8KEK3_9APHY|nr:uncharacterized protein C8Q71DRAFT_69459 [Rhodofomes roseus]KAH9836167.1 hypothetical protein C8Q71DRAFT_69459 [Rhodofomes roseus]
MSDTESDGSSSDTYSSRRFVADKSTGACANCKTLKIRCEWIIDEGICVKCKSTGADCMTHGRKKRRPAMSHEQLMKRSEAQDAHIQSLLGQLDGLKRLTEIRKLVAKARDESAALMARSSGVPMDVYPDEHLPSGAANGRDKRDPSRAHQSSVPCVETARTTASFFLPYYSAVDWGTFICPPILKCGLFGPVEVTALFKLYFDKLYPSFAILDPALHTPEYVLSKSSLLFTTVLYVTSRLWTHRPKLHVLARAHTTECVKEAVREGYRTIETCQALTLLALFPAPHRSWVDHRGWMLMGIAIRIVQDLKLDEPPPADILEREKLNRLRTWFQIVAVDASNAIQKGQPTWVQRNNFTSQMTDLWYRCSPLNSPYDIYCSAYADLMSFTSNVWGPTGPTSMNSQEDDEVIDTILSYHRSVCGRVELWQQRIAEHHIHPAVAAHRDPKLKLLGYALRLSVLGVGFQHSVKRMLYPNMELLNLAVEAARHVLEYDTEHIYPTGVLRYAIEPQYIFVTYSAAFLINLLRPCLALLLQGTIRTDIFREVRTLIEVFNCRDVAIDRTHIAVVYAGFLEALLDQITAGQDLADDLSAHPSTPTPSNPSLALTHGTTSEAQGSSSHVVDIESSQGAEFTIQRFVADVTTHQTSAYPVPAATWHGFPVDEGIW